MRPWFLVLLSILALFAMGCPDDDGDDDDSAVSDDDDDTSTDDDDDTAWDNPYEPPLDLAPYWEFDVYDPIGSAEDCMKFVTPGFSYSLVELMESLVAEHGNETCPVMEESGPYDEKLTTYTGGCETGGWAFDGSYSVLDTDAGSFHIYTFDADQFYVRPSDNDHESGDIQDDEYFFHGMLTWSYTMEDVFGTFGVGLGASDTDDPETDVLQEGFEAHYGDGSAPGDPSWSHVYVKGWTDTTINADGNVEHNQDQYVTSSGFWTFTSTGIDLTSNDQICEHEPLSGYLSINGYETILFAPDGEETCNGQVPVYGPHKYGSVVYGYYTGDIW